MIFHQLLEAESSTYTYLLADEKTKEAVLIDSVIETVDRDLKLIKEMGLNLKYIIDTHIHADHITGAGEIRKRTGAKTAVSKNAHVDCADIKLAEGDVIKFGSHQLKAMETPGHTDSCMSFVGEGMVFTGDVILIRGTGRTDFQQGSSEKMFNSITQKIFTLPNETKIYPAHDYKGLDHSTVGQEKQFNPRIGGNREKSEFMKIMSELKLAQPKKIHEAVPANLLCGLRENQDLFTPQSVDGSLEISVMDLNEKLTANKEVKLIDVRSLDEYHGELKHIKGARLVTLGPALENFLKEDKNKDQEIVFICRSGGRSGSATSLAKSLGFRKPINVQGGMISWNQQNFPVED